MLSPLRLPIFPIGLVLFPGVTLPLHIFEPRYRQLVADVRGGTRRFGIIAAIGGADERALPAGRAGCVAEVTEVELLPDGCSNIVVVGRERFALDAFVDDPAPYHVADVLPFSDIASAAPVALVVAADELATRFRRVVEAVHTLADDDAPVPSLPDDPALVPFAIAAMIDLDLGSRQELLAERSAAERLSQVDAILRRVLPDLELRAAMHQVNGDTA